MRVAAVVADLITFSRIEAAASAAGASLLRVDAPSALPAGMAVDIVLVDWSAREAEWAETLAAWRNGRSLRVVLFGPHTDLEAHAAARATGLGPMWARSKLIRELPGLFAGP